MDRAKPLERAPVLQRYKIRERRVQRLAVAYGRGMGCLIHKLSGGGWTDYVCALPNGLTAFIEFKRPGEHLAGHQKIMRDKLLACKQIVLTFDNVLAFRQWLDAALQTPVLNEILESPRVPIRRR